MALARIKGRIPKNNAFYRLHYHHILFGLMALIFLTMVGVGVILYQMFHRPLPTFYAVQPNGNQMQLTPFEEPNLLPETLIRWASKAATAAYTFDFVKYNAQLNAAKPYFTPAGWEVYLRQINPLINSIVQKRLFVNGVVAGIPVISNQGELPGKGYSWRIQIPFLVTYQAEETKTKRNYYVILTIVRVPTSTNPQGIGVDQFVMV